MATNEADKLAFSLCETMNSGRRLMVCEVAAAIRVYGNLCAREAAEDMRQRAAEEANSTRDIWHTERPTMYDGAQGPTRWKETVPKYEDGKHLAKAILALPLKEPGPDAAIRQNGEKT